MDEGSQNTTYFFLCPPLSCTRRWALHASSSLWPSACEGWPWARTTFYLKLRSLTAQMISPFLSSPGLGVNPYCTGETDFPTTKKSAASADRQPYSLCSGRKSLSQQLDFPAAKAVVRTKGREAREEGARGRLPEEPSWRFGVHRVTVVRSWLGGKEPREEWSPVTIARGCFHVVRISWAENTPPVQTLKWGFTWIPLFHL